MVVEAYLLQNKDKLEELVGRFDEVYNQLFAGEKFMDILTLSRLSNSREVIDSRIVEIKTDASRGSIIDGLRSLSYYMFWCTETLVPKREDVRGILLTPPPARMDTNAFIEERSNILRQYRLKPEQVGWVIYRVQDRTLEFEATV
jgi:hypothetical protein